MGDSDGHIPAQNFIAWFITSLFMSYAFQRQPGEKHNPLAVPTYLVFFFFFLSFLMIDLVAG